MGLGPRLGVGRMARLLRSAEGQRRPGEAVGRRRLLGPFGRDRADRRDRRVRWSLARPQGRSEGRWKARRPSRGCARRREPGADARILRLHRSRHGPSDLPRRRAGSGDRFAAPGDRAAAPHLLRQHRRAVHAHRRAGRKSLAATAHRGPGQVCAERLHQGRQAGHLQEAGRGRRLRALPAQALPRHQAL
uniref:LigA n=1 Tax=Parastrongyloides trichosuri TaxID=131310 RepID=A0A0N4ZLL5_PARTI